MSNVQKMLTSYKQVYEANKTYVDKKVADLVNGAPEQLDTLQELSKALNNDKDYAATVNNALAKKLGRTEKAVSAKTADSVSWAGVTGKPSTYPPSGHNHDSAYPATNGSRATGTWGINITGSSASCTGNAKTATNVTQRQHANAVTDALYPNNQEYLPDMSFMAFWNGAYKGNYSNLRYSANGEIIGSNTIGRQSVNYANSAGSANAVAWGNVSSKPVSIVKVASWDGSTLNLTTCT